MRNKYYNTWDKRRADNIKYIRMRMKDNIPIRDIAEEMGFKSRNAVYEIIKAWEKHNINSTKEL